MMSWNSPETTRHVQTNRLRVTDASEGVAFHVMLEGPTTYVFVNSGLKLLDKVSTGYHYGDVSKQGLADMARFFYTQR
jgi:hypothetical protein